MIEEFGFTEEDLAANRAGRLTDRQIERVQRELRRRVTMLGPLLLLGPIVVTILVATAQQLGDDGDTIPIGPLLGILYAVSLLIIAPLIAIGLYSNYYRPIRKRSITSKTASLELVPHGDDIHLRMGPRWSGVRFAIDQDQADALLAGEVYTIYYTPGGKRSVFHSIDHTPPLIHPDDEDDAGADHDGDDEDDQNADGVEGEGSGG